LVFLTIQPGAAIRLRDILVVGVQREFRMNATVDSVR
jgi:hypothetical protein